jgi:putative addiction module CopG family antidote
MRSTQQMSITLPTEMAQLVKNRVNSGAYASESEVIREGLRALLEREEAVERWLCTEVVATYDAHKANPDRARPLAGAMRRLEIRMSAAENKGA